MLKTKQMNKFLNILLNQFKRSKNFFYKNGSDRYTYNECYVKLCKFIAFIKSKKEDKIIILSDKSLNYYLLTLSIILSGKTWIQISPNIPLERIKKIIKISKSKIGFFDKSFENYSIKNKLQIKLFNPEEIIQKEKFIRISSIKNNLKNKVAMIFFTSGSTSDPKGVKITYSSFIYSATQQIKKLNYTKNETFSDYHDNSFVMSLNIIFPAVYLGCAISPLTKFIDKINPINHLKKNKISVLITVPSFFLYIKNFIKNKIKLKHIIFCGENFSFNVFKILKKKIKFKILHNCYGSTELSPWVFFYKYNQKDNNIIQKFNQLPIGQSFDRTNIYVNNKNELCISGPALSQGYLTKKNNKEKFFKKNNKRFYNTGDICKIFNNKKIFLMGRNDKQIKLKGYRINLLEIENHVKKIHGIEFVMCFKKKLDEKLVLIIITKKKNIQEKVNSILLKKVPKYMIPSEVIITKKIVLNKNAKIDRIFYLKKFDK